MDINIEKFKLVAEDAKSRTGDKRWQAAIDKAVAGVESGWWIVTELSDGVMVTTECGATYHANGTCSCEAFKRGQACKHRALARLLELYRETETAPAGAVSQADDRAQLIADIERAWPATWPPLAVELMARFKKNQLEMLDDDMLRRVRLAVAM